MHYVTVDSHNATFIGTTYLDMLDTLKRLQDPLRDHREFVDIIDAVGTAIANGNASRPEVVKMIVDARSETGV